MMTRADWGVVLFALVLVPSLYINFWGRDTEGDAVRIRAAGADEIVASLHRDRELKVDGPLGTSVIEIRDGRARFTASPCRNKQCVHAGWLERGGEFAACLPNRISVAVVGSELRYDSINF